MMQATLTKQVINELNFAVLGEEEWRQRKGKKEECNKLMIELILDHRSIVLDIRLIFMLVRSIYIHSYNLLPIYALIFMEFCANKYF